jgi:hypothetical protein
LNKPRPSRQALRRAGGEDRTGPVRYLRIVFSALAVRGSRHDRRGRRKSGGSAVGHPPSAIRGPVDCRPGSQLRSDALASQSATSQGRTEWFFWWRFIGCKRAVGRVLEIPPQKLRGRERVSAGFAGGARFGHGDRDGILMDIEAHVPMFRWHVLVSCLGGCGYPFRHAQGWRRHLADRLAYREQPAFPSTSTFFSLGSRHASIVSRQKYEINRGSEYVRELSTRFICRRDGVDTYHERHFA